MGGLLELPKVFGESSDGSGRVVDNLGAIETEDARALRKMPIITNVNTDAGVARVENGITGISRREVKLFPETRVAMRNVVLAVFAQIMAISVDDRGGVVINAGHVHFVDGHNENHLVLFRQFLH